VNSAADRALARRNPLRHGLAAWGPGLLVMLADTDAGNVVAAAQAGAQWNFRLLPLVLALIPALYLVQELAARLGLFTGEGFGALVRARFGKGVAQAALAGLALASFGTLVTNSPGSRASASFTGCRATSRCPSRALPCWRSRRPAPIGARSEPLSLWACSNAPFSPSPGRRGPIPPP
jgi:hypothetical protein